MLWLVQRRWRLCTVFGSLVERTTWCAAAYHAVVIAERRLAAVVSLDRSPSLAGHPAQRPVSGARRRLLRGTLRIGAAGPIALPYLSASRHQARWPNRSRACLSPARAARLPVMCAGLVDARRRPIGVRHGRCAAPALPGPNTAGAAACLFIGS